jgi:hypothetical protein
MGALMSSNLPRTIDKNRFTKKYPYVRTQKKLSFVSDSQVFVPIEDGYYIDGALVPVPDGLWLNNEILTDLDVDFSWIDGDLQPVGDMIFGLRWSQIEPGPGGQTEGYEGLLGQVAYSDGIGNVYASNTVSIDDANSILSTAADIIPTDDLMFDLGSEELRFANVYTGDLHLRNERGHWQIVEEAECLTITNRLDGRKYKFVLEPLEEDATP